jgi:VCBS repeat protein
MTGTIHQMAQQAKSDELLRLAAEARKGRGGASATRSRSPSARGPMPRMVSAIARSLALGACLSAAFAAPAGAISPSFDPPTGLTVPGGASTVAAGDFNGDARMDLAAGYGGGSGAVSLWLGTGDPGEPFQHRSPDAAVGVQPAAMIAEDLNGDGRDDVAVVNAGPAGSTADDTVSILLGSPGGLVPGEVKTVRDFPIGLDAGDLDGDGDLDLVVANFGTGSTADPSEHVSVLTNDGNGHFAVDNVAAGCQAGGVAIADLLDDSRADLGVACSSTAAVRILARDAGGHFAQAGPDHAACSGALAGVTAGNFDGDNKADLAVDCLTDRFVVLASELGFTPLTGPDHTQANPQPWFPVRFGPGTATLLGLETEDLNGDGFEDVLATDVNNRQAVVADGHADTHFLPETLFNGRKLVGSAFPIASGSVSQVIARDVNEDGKRDLVAAAANQIVLRYNTTPVPGVRTGAASGVGDSAATVGGIVNPSGTANANNTTYRFEYGRTAAYGQSTPALPSGTSLAGGSYVPVSVVLEGLAPQTDYHYRIVASNGHGTTYGRDRTFRTGTTRARNSSSMQPWTRRPRSSRCRPPA